MDNFFRRLAPRPSDLGYTELGNLDLDNRPVVRNPDGSISTVKSSSYNIDGQEVLLPTISKDGRNWSDDDAIRNYLATGEHLGKFRTPDDATRTAEWIHNQQAEQYVPGYEDDSGNVYSGSGRKLYNKFDTPPQQSWGEMALGVLTAPQRLGGAIYDSLTPYQFPRLSSTPMNRAGAGQPITGGYGDGGWQVPPIVGEGVNAVTAVGDAYTQGMSDEEINSRALGMAGFMMGGGGPAAALERSLPQAWVSLGDRVMAKYLDWKHPDAQSTRNVHQNDAHYLNYLKQRRQETDGSYARHTLEQIRNMERSVYGEPLTPYRSSYQKAVQEMNKTLQRDMDNMDAGGQTVFNDFTDDMKLTPAETGYMNALLQSRKPEFDVIDGGLYSNASKESSIPALASALDMSPEARLARAKEMGFDTDTTWYHGTDAAFDEFDPTMGASPGVYLTKNRYAASAFGEPMALRARTSGVGSMQDLYAARVEAAKAFEPGTPDFNAAVLSALQSRGIDTIQDAAFRGAGGVGSDVMMVADPRNIRSVNAAFDPAKSDSANLLAANADSKPALLAGMAGQEEGYASGGRVRSWTGSNEVWNSLTPFQKAAAMALMEADAANIDDARNALGAMVNRAKRDGADIGDHVSKPIYQPTIEPAQERRLGRILSMPQFSDLTGWAERRWSGQEPDPVQGATHFLAPERTMVALTAREPNKYRSWPKWTGYNPETGSYKNVVLRDGSHAFVAPEGVYSAPGRDQGSINGGYGVPPTGYAGVAGDVVTADAGHDVKPEFEATSVRPLPTPTASYAVASSEDPASTSDAKPDFDFMKLASLFAEPEQTQAPQVQFTPVQAFQTQAAPIAATTPYRNTFAHGGQVRGLPDGSEPIHAGPLHSTVPGRTDHLPITVAAGSFVLPADIVSSLGEGNTNAGMEAVSQMFPLPPVRRADGGRVPIAAAGGEYVIAPETVAALSGGNLEAGHEMLDEFVRRTRAQNIQRLRALPGPEK